MITAKELSTWIDTLEDEDPVYIDDDALSLRSGDSYYEIGGGPESLEEIESGD